MGSTHATCMLSGLPITDGTPIKVVFLFENPKDYSKKPYMTSTGAYTPLSTMISAEYADYKKVDDVQETKVTDILLKTFGRTGGLKEFINIIAKGANQQIALPRYNGGLRGNVYVTYLREEVLEGFKSLSFKDLPEKLDPEMLKPSFESYKKLYDRAEQTMVGTDLSKNYDSLDQAINVIMRIIPECANARDFTNTMPEFFSSREGNLFYEAMLPYKNKLVQYAKDGVLNDEVIELFSQMEDMQRLNLAMYMMRKTWQPMNTVGGQEENFDLHQKFNAQVAAVAKKEYAARQDDRPAQKKSALKP